MSSILCVPDTIKTNADTLVLSKGFGIGVGMSLISENLTTCRINFGRINSPEIAAIIYNHNTNVLSIRGNGKEAIHIGATGHVGINQGTPKDTLDIHARIASEPTSLGLVASGVNQDCIIKLHADPTTLLPIYSIGHHTSDASKFKMAETSLGDNAFFIYDKLTKNTYYSHE